MLDFAVLSETGDREHNEDSFACAEKNGAYCFVVCDGLGGHGMGDVASAFVSNVFVEQLNTCDEYDDFLACAFSVAQEKLLIHQSNCRAKNKMRTTAAAMFIAENRVSIGHVGDSRVYVFDNNGIKQRTIDHSVPQMLALSGKIKEEEIRNHPDRNLILRAMGVEWDQPMDEQIEPFDLATASAFLLCSDGFWEYIEESAMVDSLVRSRSAEEWLNFMKTIVITNGADCRMDNFTAIAVFNKV